MPGHLQVRCFVVAASLGEQIAGANACGVLQAGNRYHNPQSGPTTQLAKYVVALFWPLLLSAFFSRPSFRMRGISFG